jgi:hypothetical protein
MAASSEQQQPAGQAPAEGAGSASSSSAVVASAERNLLEDPRFKQGLEMYKQEKWDEAMEFWGPLIQLMWVHRLIRYPPHDQAARLMVCVDSSQC